MICDCNITVTQLHVSKEGVRRYGLPTSHPLPHSLMYLYTLSMCAQIVTFCSYRMYC